MAPHRPVAETHQQAVRTAPRGTRSPGRGRQAVCPASPRAMAARSVAMLTRRQVCRSIPSADVAPDSRSATASTVSWISDARP